MSLCVVARKRAWQEYTSETRKKTGSLIHARCSHSAARYSTTVPLLSELPRKPKADIARERLEEREFFVSLLKNSPSKRATNAYTSRFGLARKPKAPAPEKTERTQKDSHGQATFDHWRLSRTGVNLGNLYAPSKSIEENPVFVQGPVPEQAPSEHAEHIHVALVKLREPQSLDDDTLSGIAMTMSQLVRLGLNIALVVDCEGESVPETLDPLTQEWEDDIYRQTQRVVTAISEHNAPGALLVNSALGYSEVRLEAPTRTYVRGAVEVANKNFVMPLLESGIIPVIPPIACRMDQLRNIRVRPDDVVLALTRELVGITSLNSQSHDLGDKLDVFTNPINPMQEHLSLDRIIVLDPLGGIPSEERPDKAHVFINMEEEYQDIQAELLQASKLTGQNRAQPTPLPNRHIKNLELAQRTLQLLPPSSSALIISPSAAAASSQPPEAPEKSPGVRTRRQKNPLIHNLLTDKSMVSSSLPLSRFAPPVHTPDITYLTSEKPTFIKKGMPLTMLPDPRLDPWTTPGPEGTTLSLKDPRINFPLLVHLIEDSFGRKLDVEHYLARIKNRLAGIIVAGEYEGGAILTWEVPPNSPNSPPVPYLDKFAVLRRAQGTGGVADIVFKALLRQCFPKGCVWRSRTNNPVNKWYTERSAGSWKLPGGQWTMFWSVEDGYGRDDMGPGSITRSREERWHDWVSVCQSVVPSWADNKTPD